jgi:hypothetical protein
MHSQSMGGGRRLALIGAVVVLIGCLLPWYTIGGGVGEEPAKVYRAFTFFQGLVVFLAGLGTLALIALPYAASPRPVAVDRGLAFGILAALAIAGLVLWVFAVLPAPQGLLPTGAYGYWISAVGGIMLGRASFEISQEPPHR